MEPECISNIIWVIITALLAGIFSVFILPWIKGKYFTFPKLEIDISYPYIGSVRESLRPEPKRIDPETQTPIFDGKILIWAATWNLKITNKSKEAAYFSSLINSQIFAL